MKNEKIEDLFFCWCYDYFNIYIPKQQNGTENTLSTYKFGLKSFRTYVNNVAKIPTNHFDLKIAHMIFYWIIEIIYMIKRTYLNEQQITDSLLLKVILIMHRLEILAFSNMPLLLVKYHYILCRKSNNL